MTNTPPVQQQYAELLLRYEDSVDRCDLLEKYVEELATIIINYDLDSADVQLAQAYRQCLVRT